MSSKFNKGFKGIDKQDGAPGTTPTDLSKGIQHVQDRFYQRRLDQQPADTGGETYYEINEWRATAWSSSYKEGSGSLMYWSPSANMGSGWNGFTAMSVASIRLRDWSGPHLTSSVSYKVGNCRDGNANGDLYGFYGLQNRSLLGRTYSGGIDQPYGDYATMPQWGICAYTVTANAFVIYEQQGTGLGTITNMMQGDSLAIQVTKDGVVSYKTAKTSQAPTSSIADFETFATSGTNIADSKSNDKDYHQVLANYKKGEAGNFAHYDWKFQGEVNFQPYWFDTQFNQTMVDIPPSMWDSGSVYNIDSAIPFTDPTFGGTSVRIDPAASTAYADAMWSKYFVTGSGEGGIYRFQMPIDPALMPVNLMCGVINYDKVASFDHQKNTVNMRPEVRTTNWDDYSGTGHSLPAWYGGGSGGQVVMTNYQPITSGSLVAVIITGSDWGFLSETGSGMTPVVTPDNGQVAVMLWKPVSTNGKPINDYVSNHWHLWAYSFKGSAAAAMPAQKLYFGNGADGAQVDKCQVGNYIMSGTI